MYEYLNKFYSDFCCNCRNFHSCNGVDATKILEDQNPVVYNCEFLHKYLKGDYDVHLYDKQSNKSRKNNI